jgi:hypothetical protein
MYKLIFIAVVGIVAAVSFVVGMASPIVAFARDNTATTMDYNMSSAGYMTGGGNATTSMPETENLPSARETGVCQPCCGTNTPDNEPMC